MKPMPLLLLALAIGVVILGAYPAMVNMASLWITTDTYMHGAFILPLAWYLFKKMPTPDSLPSRPNNITLAALVVVWGAVYLLTLLTKVNLLQQIAVVGVLPVAFTGIFGWRYVWHYRTPFILAFLCVPVGDFLIPYLQTFTADMSVLMLQLSGVTVVHNGWYIRIAAADFRVAEACSGINFLISTFAVSCFYSFLFMTKWHKRALFISLGVIVPILANGLRVYMIIMVAELGNVEAATGVDHLVYGWIFFVFVLIILFTLGHFLQDPEPSNSESGVLVNWTSTAVRNGTAPAIAILSAALVGILFKSQLEPSGYQPISASSPALTRSQLNPQFPRADVSESWRAEGGWQAHRFAYRDENAVKKVIGYENHLFDKSRWSISHKEDALVGEVPVRQISLIDANGREGTLIVTYCTSGRFAVTPLGFKHLQLKTRLMEQRDGGVAILLFKPGKHTPELLREQTLLRACPKL